MKDIKFSPEYGRQTANKIGNSKAQIEAEVKRLENIIVNDLCSRWDGQASDKYRQEFTALKADVMNKFITMLEELKVQLNSISDAMADADRQIASKIKMR